MSGYFEPTQVPEIVEVLTRTSFGDFESSDTGLILAFTPDIRALFGDASQVTVRVKGGNRTGDYFDPTGETAA